MKNLQDNTASAIFPALVTWMLQI